MNFIVNFVDDFFTHDDKIDQLNSEIHQLCAISKINNEVIKNNNKVERIIEKYTEVKKEVVRKVVDMHYKWDNLDVDFVCAVITHESARTWNPEVRSPAGAIGLMQIMDFTGRWLTEYKYNDEELVAVLENPVYNIDLGCKYLSSLIEIFGKEAALAGYNGGPRRARQWRAGNKDMVMVETQKYVPTIMNYYKEFKNIKT